MEIKGIIFDYGGTIDTDSLHWSEVIWLGFQSEAVEVTKEQFREAYVHGERTLARQPLILLEHNFLDLLKIKIGIETRFLVEKEYWKIGRPCDDESVIRTNETNNGIESARQIKSDAIALFCYNYVLKVLETSRAVLNQLADKYPLVLVSNFYGNMNTVLKDFRLDCFQNVIESAVVGVRKPNPEIFMLGVKALGMKPEETVVVGDSYTKDILPAHSIGCRTVWIKGKGWEDEEITDNVADVTISTIANLVQQAGL